MSGRFYYYWDEGNYTNGYVFNFATKEDAERHALKNHAKAWDGEVEDLFEDDEPLGIYTGE